jgi:hypoxanthine phosphoribosyltransferase
VLVALESARIAGKTIGHANQIDTIRLERFPIKTKQGERYKSPPIRTGKTVLVIDDICTQGNSFEAARAYIEKTGARCISLAWLKTINTDYEAISGALPIVDPYAKMGPDVGAIPTKTYHFSSAIKNGAATADLSEIFKRYYGWQWPSA